FLYFVLQHGDAAVGALEALVGAAVAEVVLHESTNFIPIVRNDNHLISVMGVAGSPGGSWDVGARSRALEDAFGGAMGANERLEERIAGEAVGAMQAGAGNFADGIEAGNVGFAVHVGQHAAALVMSGGDDR